jgi:hypothetical protein
MKQSMAHAYMELDSRRGTDVHSVSSKMTRPDGVYNSQAYVLEVYSAGIRTMTELLELNDSSRITFGRV